MPLSCVFFLFISVVGVIIASLASQFSFFKSMVIKSPYSFQDQALAITFRMYDCVGLGTT